MLFAAKALAWLIQRRLGNAGIVDGIWACEFIENPLQPGFLRQNELSIEAAAGIAQIGMVIDNTGKTRAIFEINKGTNKNPAIDVNSKMQSEDRRIPLQNMIYIADGPSDVPSFAVVKGGGGRAYAVAQFELLLQHLLLPLRQRLVGEDGVENGARRGPLLEEAGTPVYAGTEATAADATALLRHADVAMYAAKAEGRGRWRRFEHALDAQASRSFAWLVEDMRDGRTRMDSRIQWFVVDTDVETSPTSAVMAKALADNDIPGAIAALKVIAGAVAWLFGGALAHHLQDYISTPSARVISASGSSPAIAAAYFVSFILLGTMIMLNLFIGIIMNSMSEMHAELEEQLMARQNLAENGSIERMQRSAVESERERRATAEHLGELNNQLTRLADLITRESRDLSTLSASQDDLRGLIRQLAQQPAQGAQFSEDLRAELDARFALMSGEVKRLFVVLESALKLSKAES